MYAIIQNGSHQQKVQAGAFLRVEKRLEEPGQLFTNDKVLAFSNKEGLLTVGTPYVKGAKVQFRVIRHGKSKKKLVFKKNRRKGYRRTKGHRQEFTEIYIENLLDSSGQKISSLPLKKKAKQKSLSPSSKSAVKEKAKSATSTIAPSAVKQKMDQTKVPTKTPKKGV